MSSAAAGGREGGLVTVRSPVGERAGAGLGQDELDTAGRVEVAGEGGDDRAHLLVAGAQQERGCSPVALHAGEEERGLGVLQLGESVGLDGAAGVHVGIDQRCEAPGCLDDVVEFEADLAQRLMEEGVVIRGYDIARVVGLMAGTEVTWQEASAE